ncbi:MAG: GGDEF domain-containing protein [bacterium]|nr:GGDEF domain-containing protein [bacterium]
MGFPERGRVPEAPSESERELIRENKEQDAQIGLLEWEMEVREEQHDTEHLTGLRTRKFFDNELKLMCGEIEEKRHGVESPKKISLILIDLDHFKAVNDSLGHPAGDQVLRDVSALLIQSVRPTDVVARFGGEELIILMRGAGGEVAARHAEELRAKIEQLTFDAYPALKVTASFGVCSADVSSPTSSEAIVKHADDALYEAKEEGRNRVRVYSGT